MASSYMTRRYAQRKAAGQCVYCTGAPIPGQILCQTCKDKRASWPSRSSSTREKHGARYREKVKKDVFDRYGNVCACCGESDIQFLTIDHINNDGAQHRHVTKTLSLYQWLRTNDYPAGFQTLCWNCNLAKHIYGQCPHRADGAGD
jgi:hypothetical protein